MEHRSGLLIRGFGFESLAAHPEVFITFRWGPCSRLGFVLIVTRGSVILAAGCGGRSVDGSYSLYRFSCVRAGCGHAAAVVCVRGGAGGWARCGRGVHGGAAARLARVVRLRRRRVLGGRPWEARRALWSCRAFQAVMMRWLQTMSRVVVNSISGARPMRRHQPRPVSLLVGSLAVAKPRSAPVRRA